MNTPEDYMKEGFKSLSEARENFEKAGELYEIRNDEIKADGENVKSVREAIHYIAKADDELSAIRENDLDE
jgi:hypothetical protein